jgi:hypothetical protein
MEEDEPWEEAVDRKEKKKFKVKLGSITNKVKSIKKKLDKKHTAKQPSTQIYVPTNNARKEVFEEMQIGPKLTQSRHGSFASEKHLAHIQNALPRRYAKQPWKLLYSTREHGISINTLYDKTNEKGACIILIQTIDENIMGVFLSESLQSYKSKYYGGGESVLFTFRGRKFSSYAWSKKNEYFILTNRNYIAVGGSIIDDEYIDQSWAIYVDANLHRGSTYACETFDTKEPLHDHSDFEVYAIEIWGF